jgi:NodT family efflux transporter outer membrane factor (OMF) lipoprotein
VRDAREVGRGAEPVSAWWETLGDPILDELVARAYRHNPSLEAAGVRVLEAQARRGIAIGGLFPQTQEAAGRYQRNVLSENRANPVPNNTFGELALGFDAAWELDVWGKFRRGIESADAELLAQVASYDDVLVSLLAEVAANYVGLRALELQTRVAQENADIQRRNYVIARERAREGAASDLDMAQAESILRDTESRIPDFQGRISQTEATLTALVGDAPGGIHTALAGRTAEIPSPQAQVVVGMPADLLRRRPDVRRAERVLAAQSAQIGVAKADLLPSLALVGSIAFDAEDAAKLFRGDSIEGFGGPNFRWAILNYGRISNNVRVQDASYQALVGDYETTVLRAQAEVEGAAARYVGSIRRAQLLEQSVAAAQKAVDIVNLQYREGATDFTTVLVAQNALLDSQSRLVTSQGEVAAALIAVYKALGGGWEVREGTSFVSDDTAAAMRARTRWGALLSETGQERQQRQAESGTERDRGWFRWRAWWPLW